MKVAVVGGTGNISTSLVRRLLADGHDVSCVNRGVSGAVPAGARLVKCDRRDESTFERLMQAESFEAAIDMICFNAVEAESSIRAFRGVRHFIHTSTVRTYGTDLEWLPVTEDHPIRPTVPYGSLKAEADARFLAAYHGWGFPVTILKPSTTYGPLRIVRQLGLDTIWLRRIREGKPILVLGDATALHHFLHVADAANAFAGILDRENTVGQVYNLVNPRPITWDAYHRAAMKVLGKEVEQVSVSTSLLSAVDEERFGMATGVFALNCLYSGEKLRRDMPGFAVTVSVEDGLRDCIESLARSGGGLDEAADAWEDEVVEMMRSVLPGLRLCYPN